MSSGGLGPRIDMALQQLLRATGGAAWGATKSPPDELRQTICALLRDVQDHCRQHDRSDYWGEGQEWLPYRDLFEHAPVAYLVTDTRGVIRRANRAAADLLGVPVDALMGIPLTSQIALADRPLCTSKLLELEQGGHSPISFHVQLLPRNGASSRASVTLASARIAVDAPVSGFSWILQDITGRILVHEMHAWLASIVESSEDAIIGMNLDGMVTSWNRGAERMYGYPFGAMIGRHISAIIPTGHSEEVDRYLSYIRAGEPVEAYETIRLRNDGKRIHVSLSISPIRGISGDVVGASAIARDISQRIQMDQELRAARKEAEQANRAKSLFLGNISHEMRTPTNAICGFAELMLDSELTAEQRQIMEIIKARSEDLLALTGDLLDLTKVEAGILELVKEEFSLQKTVLEAITTVELSARKKDIDLTWRVDPTVPDWLCGDPLRLRQVLLNLLANSTKYTSRGSVHLGVELSPSPPLSDAVLLQFSIQDSGIGIPSDQLASVFEPFVRCERPNSPRTQGVGLGLSISKHLVELMGGNIVAESVEGEGSTFRFTIPAQTASPRTESPPSHHPSSVSLMAGHDQARALHVLVVEDDPTSQLLVALILKRMGYDVDTRNDGQAALLAVRDQQFDLVLMDVSMPGLDGIDATTWIRNLERDSGRHTPIIALTALAMAGDAERCLQAGFDAYVPKPIRLPTLRDAIGCALARRQPR